jgi:hypothetical protein
MEIRHFGAHPVSADDDVTQLNRLIDGSAVTAATHGLLQLADPGHPIHSDRTIRQPR